MYAISDTVLYTNTSVSSYANGTYYGKQKF